MDAVFDIKIFSLFVIFFISLVIPEIFPKKFSTKLTKELTLILQFIKTMIDEDSGRIAVNSSIDSKAHPLFFAVTKFIDEILAKSEPGNSVRTTIPEEFKSLTSQNSDSASISFTPLSNANNTFYTTVQKRTLYASLILNISDGSALSDWDAYNSDLDKRRIALTCAIAGIMIDAINAKRCLISVEPFLLSSQMKALKDEKTLNVSGAYIFLGLISLIILLFSVFKTLAIFYPQFDNILNFFGMN